MIRIYYDPSTGEIRQKISLSHAFNNNKLPYIDIENDIKIYEWRVNVTLKKLVPSGLSLESAPKKSTSPIQLDDF